MTANPAAAAPIRRTDGLDRLIYVSLKEGIFMIPARANTSVTSVSISALEEAPPAFTRIIAAGEKPSQPPWAAKYCSETIAAYKDRPVPEAAVFR